MTTKLPDDGFVDAVLMIAVVCVVIAAIKGLCQLLGLAWAALFV